MPELKFLANGKKETGSDCGCAGPHVTLGNDAAPDPCCTASSGNAPAWVAGTVMSPIGLVQKVSTELSKSDRWEHVRCRTTSFRNNYMVNPGLYAVGNPDKDSDVLVSANYKLSFDMLRRELTGLNAWILVLDTKGINVWCAAGKGTFGTDELVKRIRSVQLDRVVVHRRVIVPQLGAPGVSAQKVMQASGFRVLYGPVYARDIAAYIRSGYKATREMRKVTFSLSDRLVLIPMEINPAMKNYPLFALLILVVFGLQPHGIVFKDAFTGGLPFVLLGFISVFAGALFTPVFLPFVPFRSFALKGWVAGLLLVFLSIRLIPLFDQSSVVLLSFTYLFFPIASSYIALQFTGATTFTGMSGVKKELKVAIPVYISSAAVSLALLVMFKLSQWRVI